MVNTTALLMRLIFADSQAEQQLLGQFFAQVARGASRRESVTWLQECIESAPGQREALLQCGIDTKNVRWDLMVEFCCACWYAADRRRSALPQIPNDDIWNNPARDSILAMHPQRDRPIKYTVPVEMLSLEKRLLAIGGTRVVYIGEPHLKQLLERGFLADGRVELLPGTLSRCHANVSHIWEANPQAYRIATGYALSEDGLWRQHSWLRKRRLSSQGEADLIETTVLRSKYFGFELEHEEAGQFAEANG